MLQLGRGRTTAERKERPIIFDGESVLQLGRGRTTAERCHDDGRQNCPAASIGPRSNDRGKPEPSPPAFGFSSPASIGPRSNDRGKVRSVPFVGSVSVASIGPRSNDRGKRNNVISFDEVPFASIGPRSNDRGKLPSVVWCSTSMAGFNWAAVERPRKVWLRCSDGPDSVGFNWAAVERPRKALAHNTLFSKIYRTAFRAAGRSRRPSTASH